MSEIAITVSIMSRGRRDGLKDTILRFFQWSKHPEQIELFVLLDDDDDESINMMMTDEDIKKYKTMKLFLGPRVGFHNFSGWMKFVYSIAQGDVIVPAADDFKVNMKNWDEVFLQFRDEPAYIGWRARLALTRKAIEQHEFFTEGWKLEGADGHMFEYAREHNLYRRVGKWFGKAHYNDKTSDDHYGENKWELEDKSILDNLVYEEIDIYG